MSNGDDIIIICGTGGTPVTDKTIVVYDGPLSVAIKIDKPALEAQAVAAGMDPGKAHRRVARLAQIIESDWWRWGEYMEDRLGVDYERHEPHAQNFP